MSWIGYKHCQLCSLIGYEWCKCSDEYRMKTELATKQPTKHDTTTDKETAHDKVNHSAP